MSTLKLVQSNNVHVLALPSREHTPAVKRQQAARSAHKRYLLDVIAAIVAGVLAAWIID